MKSTTEGVQAGDPKPAGFFSALTTRLNHYRFESTWKLEGGCEEAFEALQDLFSYPSWWPEVKRVTVADDGTAAVVIRALLPYTLRFRLQQQVADSQAGILEASLTGDLEGWSRWSLFSSPDGCRLKFEEEVRVNRPLLKRLSPVARYLLKANHAIMMRRGETGLRQYLARRGRRPSEV